MKINEKFAFLGLLLVFHTSFLKGQSDLFGNQQIISLTANSIHDLYASDLNLSLIHI